MIPVDRRGVCANVPNLAIKSTLLLRQRFSKFAMNTVFFFPSLCLFFYRFLWAYVFPISLSLSLSQLIIFQSTSFLFILKVSFISSFFLSLSCSFFLFYPLFSRSNLSLSFSPVTTFYCLSVGQSFCLFHNTSFRWSFQSLCSLSLSLSVYFQCLWDFFFFFLSLSLSFSLSLCLSHSFPPSAFLNRFIFTSIHALLSLSLSLSLSPFVFLFSRWFPVTHLSLSFHHHLPLYLLSLSLYIYIYIYLPSLFPVIRLSLSFQVSLVSSFLSLSLLTSFFLSFFLPLFFFFFLSFFLFNSLFHGPHLYFFSPVSTFFFLGSSISLCLLSLSVYLSLSFSLFLSPRFLSFPPVFPLFLFLSLSFSFSLSFSLSLSLSPPNASVAYYPPSREKPRPYFRRTNSRPQWPLLFSWMFYTINTHKSISKTIHTQRQKTRRTQRRLNVTIKK